MSVESIVIATDLNKTFKTEQKGLDDVQALQGINMQIKAGQLTALVGPDGAGKTTFLRLIAGLYEPTTGSLKVLGMDVAKDPQSVQDRISYMPQKFGLYEDLSIQENLDLYADLHGVPMDVRKERFARLLKITDLARFTERPAGKLSGGMKQKLGLACTLVRSPELLLLDEPSVGVDPLSRRDLWIIIEQLVREENLSVILSTAYMDEAERCHEVYVMLDGQVLKQGTPDELTAQAQGQTWQVEPSPDMKARVLQAHLLDNQHYIADAVPKGNVVRFITRIESPSLPADLLPKGIVAEPRAAELEDAFMLLLHEAKHTQKTVLAQENLALDPSITLIENSDSPQVKTKQDVKQQLEKPVIVVKDLVRTFGDFTAVANTSFDVYRGEIFGLLGPNGAGKTTTFRMLCGLLPASSGVLEVAGMNLRTARAQARAKIGYVSQKFALYGNLSVLDNLKFFGGAYGLSGKHLKQQIDKALLQFELKPHAKSGDLPNGFKQRLSMAAALLHQPEIVFLDEPTSGIDPLARRSFWYTIGELANQGMTIIVTTHFMEEAEYCDRIAIQDAGKLLAIGTPQQIRGMAQLEGVNDMNSAFIAIVEQSRADMQAH
ncbi:ATP-binding cassette domain-containing protein [Acinetobacter johnsonii]|uniref:ABC transporter ATP-binding protein n=1 Tax=Acinetobacter johnsonii TaxID=40214 RepID=A0A3R9F5W6_ACIJO|nr:ATP-binding cassette domain-containing protein [Acinetobacter johnsonii]MDH0713037.1 ATP-binding cassette domain-containing protein [Acinetobacter johnsonii]MDH1714434.1 ATP-binding cassette domain-containing protein [Acinetobacter johnsonii]RSE26493.1 ABC transporter ATP-binding protein [Acinetobacter johnsonii]